MPRFNWTRILIAQLAVLAGIVLLIVAWTMIHAVFHTLLLFVITAILAFALVPLVAHAEARSIPRVLAVALVYLGLALLLIIGTGLLARPFALQATLLLENLPAYLAGLQDVVGGMDDWLGRFGLGGGIAMLEAEVGRQATARARSSWVTCCDC